MSEIAKPTFTGGYRLNRGLGLGLGLGLVLGLVLGLKKLWVDIVCQADTEGCEYLLTMANTSS